MIKFEINQVKELYNKFNQTLFNNELPSADEIVFRFFKSKNYLAMVEYPHLNSSNIKFYLNQNVSFETEKSLHYTVIHEMIHVYQWTKKFDDLGHGKWFKFISMMIANKTNNDFDIKRMHYGEAKIESKTRKEKFEKMWILYHERDNQIFYKVYKFNDFIKDRNFFDNLLRFTGSKYKIMKYEGIAFSDKRKSPIKIARVISFKTDDGRLKNILGSDHQFIIIDKMF